ncbi:hypothetical protein [Methylorubrum sp. SL192]|uniref:hypothetical protein n=1 Tax=Methylorubrum sp. SL192 TaxID=2995167 RepID=UPI002272B07E|nr:hypothetical protein [Methylorubrum sp. SL192]MCY1643153.1 hypothetical protein [Methylorubrum sp. SL192]
MTVPTSVDDWVATIAREANAKAEDVRSVLDRHGIVAQATLPRLRRLGLSSIKLRGTKRTEAGETGIEFDWTDLTPGLWALLSDDNSSGKSSLLNIVQAALRGEFPLHVKPDVWSWLSLVEVDFKVEQTVYRVSVSKTVGEKDPKLAEAVLSRLDRGDWFVIYAGAADEGLSEAVADNMMEEFAFAKFFAFNKDTGSHAHGWQAIASSLFVTGPGKAVFGEVVQDGMPLRLLQMFMGLPWVSTYSAAATAEKKVLAERDRAMASSPVRDRLATRLASAEAALGEARAALADRVDRVALRRELVIEDRKLVDFQTKVEEGRAQVTELARQAASARDSASEVNRTLQQMADERAAGLVFRVLRPVCCPSCDAGIDAPEYKTAEAGGTCALCKTEHVVPEDDTALLDDLKEDFRDAEAVAARLEAQLEAAKRRRRAYEDERDGAQRAIDGIKSQLASSEEADAEMRVRALEAQVAQLKEIIDEQSPFVPLPAAADAEVLKHTVRVTKDLYDEMQRDLLKEVSAHLLRLSTLFGVKHVTEMDWTPNGVLNIKQGGTDLTFKKLSPGEKLRVRIAAALAVIDVARRRHYGRHPGFLVLDSPAAQEMTADKFGALLASVKEAVSQADDVQVIVGAVARPELLSVVESKRRLHAKGARFLF